MPNEVLRNLSIRIPTGLQAVRNILGSKAHVASRYVNEILQVVQSASAEWREQGEASTLVPYELELSQNTTILETDTTKVAHAADRAVRIGGDIWNDHWLTTPRAGTSSLFGEALKPTERPRPKTLPTSSLFGHTFSNTTSDPAGLSFLDVRQAVHAEFEQTFVPPHPVPHSLLVEKAEEHITLPEPESVPFKSASSSTTTMRPVVEATSVLNPDGIVPVKRRRPKQNTVVSENDSITSPVESSDITHDVSRVSAGKAALATKSGSTSMSPSKVKRRKTVVTPNVASVSISARPTALASDSDKHALIDKRESSSILSVESSPKKHAHAGARPQKKTKEGKMRMKDIPEFLYADEPNLLDHPASFRRREGKMKGKKEKKKGKTGESAILFG